MLRVVIDGREVTVPAGSTVLDAARRLGIEIPTLCSRDGCRPETTCMVCLVKVAQPNGQKDNGNGNATGRLVPACATVVWDGMRIESETDEVWQVRRAALELLLSDHIGQCRAPCQYACPFGTDIPRMMRQVAAGQLEEAAATLRREMPLAAVLARVSTEVCEGACRRCTVDEPAAIGLLKRYVAERDLASPRRYVPPCKPPSGKRVAIVGAGPAGLSAAYFLLQAGRECTVFDANGEAGGTLREIPTEKLSREVLAAEIGLIEKLGARFVLGKRVDRERGLDGLRRQFDAVLIATGQSDADGRLQADRTTHQTEITGVFAAGDVTRAFDDPGRAAADGKVAAACIDQFLCGAVVAGRRKLTALRMTRPQISQLTQRVARVVPCGEREGFTDDEARAEARRCLHCDCHKLDTCRLRKYAELYGADGGRYRGARRKVAPREEHPRVVYEPGKCILCGLCVQIAQAAGEPLGLAFIGRGFDVRVGVPFDEPLSQALRIAAQQCIAACPTGALAAPEPGETLQGAAPKQ